VTPGDIKDVGKRRRPEDIPLLVAWLRGADDGAARVQAAACLGWQRTADVLAPLVEAAGRDPDAEVRAAALRALGSLKAPGAGDVLEAALVDADPVCRSLGLRLAGQLGRGLEAVRKALQDPQSPACVAYEACLAAGRLGDGQMAPALWRRYEEDADEVRRAAAIAWCNLAVQDAIERLVSLLDDRDPDIRVAAMGLMEKLDPPGGAERVQRLIDDPHPAVKRVAEGIYGRISGRSKPPSPR
jgi:HEAT repeat protein